MLENYLDIVNENDELTGEKKPRSEAHSTGLWHRSVHIYIFRKNNSKIDFLVHLRSSFKDLYPNCWDTRFGGHLSAGESWEKAASRELKEELNLKVKIYNLVLGPKMKNSKNPLNREINQIFYYKIDKPEKFKFKDSEVQEVKWLSKKDILKELKSNPKQWASDSEEFTKINDYLERLL